MTMRFLKDTTHRRWRRDLSPFIDGQLELSRREALERHLATCASCREDLSVLRKVVAMLYQVAQVEVPRSFVLAQAPSLEFRRPALYGKPLQYATAIAAMLLVAVVVGDMVTGLPQAPAPGSPDVTQLQRQQDQAGSAAGPAAKEQVLTETTPTPQPMPLAAAEKAQETVDAGMPTSTAPGGPGALHNWFRWGEIAIGAVLAVLAGVVSVQWWRGHRQRQG